MTAAFDVGAVGVSVSTSSDAGLVLAMKDTEGADVAPEAATSFLGLGFGDNPSGRKLYLSNGSGSSDIDVAVTSEERLQVTVPIVGTVDTGAAGTFGAQIVDFEMSLDPSVLIQKFTTNGSIDPATDLFVANDLGQPTITATIDVDMHPDRRQHRDRADRPGGCQ